MDDLIKDNDIRKYCLRADSRNMITNLKEALANDNTKNENKSLTKKNSQILKGDCNNRPNSLGNVVRPVDNEFVKNESLKDIYSPYSVINTENTEIDSNSYKQTIKSPYFNKKEEINKKKKNGQEINKNSNTKLYTKRVIKNKKCDVETLEYVLRTKFTNNHKTNMEEYLKKVGLQENTKVFCCNTQDSYVRRALLSFGWYENKNINSFFFDLKWVYIDDENDYKFLIEGQYYNHFQNNKELTTKIGLTNNMKEYCEYGVNFDEFYPRCYDLGNNKEMNEFIIDFENTNMMILLKKHIKYFKTKCPLKIKEVKKQLINKETKKKNTNEKEILWKRFRKKPQNIIKTSCFQEEEKNKDFLVNINLLHIAIHYYKTLYHQIINFIDEGKHYDLNKIDKKFKEELMEYSKFNCPYESIPPINRVFFKFYYSKIINIKLEKTNLLRYSLANP